MASPHPVWKALNTFLPIQPGRARISPDEAEQFLSELGSWTALGQSVPCSLRRLAERQPSGACQRAFQQLAESVDQGRSLSEALAQFPSTFSPIVISVLREADYQHQQPHRLALALHLSLMHHAKSRVRVQNQQEMARSCAIIVSLIVLLLVLTHYLLMTCILPLYRELGIILPFALEAWLSVWHAIRDVAWLVAIGAGLIGAGAWMLMLWPLRRPSGDWKQRWFHLPVVHYYAQQLLVARFGQDMGTLLRGGLAEHAAFALAAAQQTSRYAISRLAAFQVLMPGQVQNGTASAAFGMILTVTEQQHLCRAVSLEERGHTLQELAAIHALHSRRIEIWSRRALLLVLCVLLVFLMNVVVPVMFMASREAFLGR